MYLFQPDSNTVLDGFTLCFGRADDQPSAGSTRDRAICGGGLYIEAGNWDALVNIINCRFWRNSSLSFGGGVMTNGASVAGVAPRFAHCRFEENHTEGGGGGLARFGGSWKERGYELEACVFVHNVAAQRGGGLYYSDTNGPNKVSVEACVFEHNHAELSGGGIFLLAGKNGVSGHSLGKCAFLRNTSGQGAALTEFTNGNYFIGLMKIDSCAFLYNKSITGFLNPSIVFTDIYGSEQTEVLIENSNFNKNNGLDWILFISWTNAKVNFENISITQDTASLINVELVSNLKIDNSKFYSNVTSAFALINHDVYQDPVDNYLTNCLVANNKSEGNNLVLFRFNNATNRVVNLINCAFVNNEDMYFSSNTSILDTNSLVIYNAITKQNPTTNYFKLYHNFCYFSNSFLDYPDCQSLPDNVTCGPGNLFGLDPQFRDTAAGDFTLLPCSPLINAGTNAPVAGLLTDLAGNPRILEGVVDIGPYEAPAFSSLAEPLVKPACSGASNGSISVSHVNGCEPYTYQWDPFVSNGPELTSLPPGTYRLTVTDSSGRQLTDTMLVGTAPVPELALTATAVQCSATLGGTLSSGANGGTPPYQHQWLPAAPDTAYLSLLGPGFYALTVTDVHGCQDSASAQIGLQGLITLLLDGQAILCYGETGWLSATPVTGTAPFSWQWQGWAGTDSLAQPLGPGTYSVTVSDVYGCTASAAFPPMTQPDSLRATTTATAQTQISPPNGEAAVLEVLGGKSPFEFLWSTGSTLQAIQDLPAGVYILTITDINGCTTVNEVVVEWMVSTGSPAVDAMLLYPNPTTDWILAVLPIPERSWRLVLTDAGGKVVLTEQTAASEHRFDLRTLAAGGYLLLVQDDAGQVQFVKEVVKL